MMLSIIYIFFYTERKVQPNSSQFIRDTRAVSGKNLLIKLILEKRLKYYA